MSVVQIRLPVDALATAVKTRLASDLTATVFDREPSTKLTRYVVLSEVECEQWSTKDQGGTFCEFEVEVRHRSRSGASKCRQLMDEVVQALTGTNLDLSASSFTVLDLELQFMAISTQGEEHLGVLRFECHVDDTQ